MFLVLFSSLHGVSKFWNSEAKMSRIGLGEQNMWGVTHRSKQIQANLKFQHEKLSNPTGSAERKRSNCNYYSHILRSWSDTVNFYHFSLIKKVRNVGYFNILLRIIIIIYKMFFYLIYAFYNIIIIKKYTEFK